VRHAKAPENLAQSRLRISAKSQSFQIKDLTQRPAPILAQVCVGLRSGFGPKGLGKCAQALAHALQLKGLRSGLCGSVGG
jgi:hypothetical protein